VSNSVDPQAIEANPPISGDSRSIEAGFKVLWESARRAAETITRLREEKHDLQEAVKRLEKELLQLRQEAIQLKRQISEHGNGKDVAMAGGERDALAAKVKELISKLDAYL
jgi:phage shock protein A